MQKATRFDTGQQFASTITQVEPSSTVSVPVPAISTGIVSTQPKESKLPQPKDSKESKLSPPSVKAVTVQADEKKLKNNRNSSDDLLTNLGAQSSPRMRKKSTSALDANVIENAKSGRPQSSAITLSPPAAHSPCSPRRYSGSSLVAFLPFKSEKEKDAALSSKGTAKAKIGMLISFG